MSLSARQQRTNQGTPNCRLASSTLTLNASSRAEFECKSGSLMETRSTALTMTREPMASMVAKSPLSYISKEISRAVLRTKRADAELDASAAAWAKTMRVAKMTLSTQTTTPRIASTGSRRHRRTNSSASMKITRKCGVITTLKVISSSRLASVMYQAAPIKPDSCSTPTAIGFKTS